MTPTSEFLTRPQGAHFLGQMKSKIILDWENRCRTEVPEARNFNKLALTHSVPNFLDRLISSLSSNDLKARHAEILASGVGHALEKADLREYSLDQVLHEFQLLRFVITDCFDLEHTLAKDGQDIFHEFLDLGIRKAASRFSAITTEKQSQRHLATEKETLKETQKVTDRREDVLKERNVTIGNLEDERDLRSKFVNTLTHDLRTPMTAIKMTAQLLKRKSWDPIAVQNACRRIVANTDRADRMIRDMLDVNRLKAGECVHLVLENCQLDILLQKICEELVILYGDRFKIQGELPLIVCVVDSEGIRRMVENLASNAVKYGMPNAIISIGLAQKEESAEIVVHNVGKFITPEDQKTLFQAYRRTRSAIDGVERGWGIGLTVVDGIAKAHGGTAWVTSDEKQGTNFYISIPIKNKAPSK